MLKRKVFKSRFLAYKFFKDGKRIPGLLTVSQGRLLPEFYGSANNYIAGWPFASQVNHSVYHIHNKEQLAFWKRYMQADRVQRIIVESEYVQY